MIEELIAYLKVGKEPLCPACGQARVDPRSPHGWCPRCTGRRESQLASKRAWWARNRGAEAPEELRSLGRKRKESNGDDAPDPGPEDA